MTAVARSSYSSSEAECHRDFLGFFVCEIRISLERGVHRLVAGLDLRSRHTERQPPFRGDLDPRGVDRLAEVLGLEACQPSANQADDSLPRMVMLDEQSGLGAAV